ncbi:hypothetical protein [Candidatus Viridilinea mediisalina]|uniref:hypothetical protein n=1 Tax=Candidatus Viridilinea mediisalina TaxID=2024553 RepID=UPI001C2C0C52|nr:hypothetical protein [Candidatus Viridilinea mediisalina]
MLNQTCIARMIQSSQRQQALLQVAQRRQVANDLMWQDDHGQGQVAKGFQHQFCRGTAGGAIGVVPRRAL